jgi:N-hydroxyarylamine O-acetyltransferase
MKMKNIDQYLQRINYDGPRTPDVETLRRLHLAHLYAVPFENLSIHASEPIELNDESLFQKIVVNKRGGFCYEDNGLFAWLLRELGYDVTKLSARVVNGQGEYGPEFDHMTLMVKLDEPWLCDVGFGDSFREPLRLDERGPQAQGSNAYRLDAEEGEFTLHRSVNGGEWQPQYRFTLRPYEFADYDEMCRFHQTSPESHFTKAPVCSLATTEGRLTLTGMKLITTSTVQQVRDERILASDDEYNEVLRDKFGIVM